MQKISEKIVFHLPMGGYSPLALPWRHLWFSIAIKYKLLIALPRMQLQLPRLWSNESNISSSSVQHSLLCEMLDSFDQGPILPLEKIV